MSGSPNRPRIALALAALALAAAVVGAIGPAEAARTTYSWPPRALPEQEPTSVWHTPLLLIRHRPESLAATVPCALPSALPAARPPIMVLATARDPSSVGGLSVERAGGGLRIAIGDRLLASVDLPPQAMASDACVYRLHLARDRWALEGGPGDLELGGDLEAMPVVFGLFSAVDMRRPLHPTVDVTTAVHASPTTPRQTAAWILAGVSIAAALAMLGTADWSRRRSRDVRHVVRAALARLAPADAVVATALLGWWVISPAFWDDGYLVARWRAFSTSGGFSTYYNVFGANLPLDYWLEWAQRSLVGASNSMLLFRLPALACLAGTWVLVRWTLVRLAAPRGRGDVVLWALASAFLTGALAWGMTLRPEPAVALLATLVMACAMRFAERETIAPLAAMALLVPLALSAHHSGVVAIAPVIAIAPQIAHWARGRVTVAATIVTAGVATLVVLAFVGSDVEQRLADARTASLYGISHSWRDEASRYVQLGVFPFGTPLRRASVALIALAVLAFVLRRARRRRLLDLPSTTLAIALVLLIATPSKHPWHFGALLGIAALAVGAETARIRDEAATARRLQARPLIFVGAAVMAAAWSWEPRNPWNPVDLRTLTWAPGVEALWPFAAGAIVAPLVALFGANLIALARGRTTALPTLPWRVASWTAPLLSLPLVAFTAVTLVADAVKTESWTLARQNVESLAGDPACGLADDVLASNPGSARPLRAVGSTRPRPAPAWIPSAPAPKLPRFELRAARRGSASSPWFELPRGGRFGIFVAGSPRTSDHLVVEWARIRRGRVTPLGTSDVSSVDSTIHTAPWRFVAASELPRPDSVATVVRLTLRGDVHGAALAVTAPVTYSSHRLAPRIASAMSRSLVHPSLLLYLPCAKLPQLREGTVEAPHYLVWFDHPFQPHPFEFASPFLGIRDLYEVQRWPLTDTPNPPPGVVVFAVDRRIPGGIEATPTKTTTKS